MLAEITVIKNRMAGFAILPSTKEYLFSKTAMQLQSSLECT
ncbi:hypothetical protein GPUN_2345 [Glaciecola punicea ACAM 611]|uniref:Uncharacterized protein n=1 Tax=Glaciecola punicea ACAM 611 TaxID=1121923 RepID=H5TDT3_9ALTE|nr:hypothetical protein GPUN_2345 [Glaciecola punicea ACAM 611]